ncbi:MAG: hypothetical protein IKF11_10785 [Methanobrevibacter sp.]|nr:hypothetical protein [Methanobrevibacter sp.]
MKIGDLKNVMMNFKASNTPIERDLMRSKRIGVVLETKDGYSVLYSGDISKLPDKYLDAEVETLSAGSWNYKTGVIVGVKIYEKRR